VRRVADAARCLVRDEVRRRRGLETVCSLRANLRHLESEVVAWDRLVSSPAQGQGGPETP
jgi:hypothetical protein